MKKTQKAKVMNYMKEHGEISQRDAYKMGIYRLAAVIWDLIHEDHIYIKSERRKVQNSDGSFSRVGFYSLPDNQMSIDEFLEE